MKTITTLLITLSLLIGIAPTQQKEELTITVTIDGLRNENGYVAVALHNGDTEFPGGEGFMNEYVEAKKGSIEVTFKKVPAGEYAIAILHDENGDEEMSFNEYGMPLEGFGFSNEAKAETGPPTFGDASFDVSEDSDQYIEIVYIGG